MIADIAFSQEGHLGLVNLKRPQALNALNLPMINALQQQLMSWQNDYSIHAVVVQSEGGKAFCAGGDVRWLYEAGLSKNPEQMQFFWHEYRLNHYIHQFKKPYIAFLDGITMGGGVGISLHGSHPIATERFVFAMPETGIGFFPDIGASYLLSRCPGQTGIYLGLTGNRLHAADACTLGLVKKMIAFEQVPSVLARLVASDLSQDAHQRVSVCLEEFGLTVEQAPIEKERSAIDSCFAEQTIENILSKLDARGDDWSQKISNNLDQKAPLSLKITLAQIRQAKLLSMAECMKMDYRLVSHFMRDADFYEGIRALLVDKDKKPHWQPSSLALVSEAKVADYFENAQSELPLISNEHTVLTNKNNNES